MRKYLVLAGFLVLLTGCLSSGAKKLVMQQAALSKRMVTLIEEKKTTQDQEQDFIKADAKVWASFNEAVNGKKTATATPTPSAVPAPPGR